MERFRDRKEAGQRLALVLSSYKKKKNTIIVGLPRGGVVTAYEIASNLDLPLDIIVPRKIGSPTNPELAIGAIAEDQMILHEDLIADLKVSSQYLKKEIEKEKKEAKRRLETYRRNRPPLNMKDKSIILVDDGIATGATMIAAIRLARAKKAKEVIVAIPVAPPETIEKIQKEADRVFCLSTPIDFYGISQFYDRFPQTTDEEVISLLERKKYE